MQVRRFSIAERARSRSVPTYKHIRKQLTNKMQVTMSANMTRHAFTAPAARPSMRSSPARLRMVPRATPPRPTEADPNNPLDQVRFCALICSTY